MLKQNQDTVHIKHKNFVASETREQVAGAHSQSHTDRIINYRGTHISFWEGKFEIV